MTTAQDGGKVVSLTHRPPLPAGNAPGTHFCYRLSRPQGHGAIGRIMSIQWHQLGSNQRPSNLYHSTLTTVLPRYITTVICSYFNDALASLHYSKAWNCGIISVYYSGSRRGLIWSTYLVFAWGDWGEPRKACEHRLTTTKKERSLLDRDLYVYDVFLPISCNLSSGQYKKLFLLGPQS